MNEQMALPLFAPISSAFATMTANGGTREIGGYMELDAIARDYDRRGITYKVTLHKPEVLPKFEIERFA